MVHATHSTSASADMTLRNAKPEERRQLRELQRDARLERVHRPERAPDHRGARAHRHHRHPVDADAPAEQHHHRHERDDLLLHVLERAHRREQRRDDGITAAGRCAGTARPACHHRPHSVPRRSTMTHAPPTNQDDDDDVGGSDEAARHRDGRGKRADGARGNWMVGAGHHDAPPCGGVVAPVVFAGRNDPGGDGGHRHRSEQKHERRRQPEAHAISRTRCCPGSPSPACSPRTGLRRRG